jgi:hypothetical protein
VGGSPDAGVPDLHASAAPALALAASVVPPAAGGASAALHPNFPLAFGELAACEACCDKLVKPHGVAVHTCSRSHSNVACTSMIRPARTVSELQDGTTGSKRPAK